MLAKLENDLDLDCLITLRSALVKNYVYFKNVSATSQFKEYFESESTNIERLFKCLQLGDIESCVSRYRKNHGENLD